MTYLSLLENRNGVLLCDQMLMWNLLRDLKGCVGFIFLGSYFVT